MPWNLSQLRKRDEDIMSQIPKLRLFGLCFSLLHASTQWVSHWLMPRVHSQRSAKHIHCNCTITQPFSYTPPPKNQSISQNKISPTILICYRCCSAEAEVMLQPKFSRLAKERGRIKYLLLQSPHSNTVKLTSQGFPTICLPKSCQSSSELLFWNSYFTGEWWWFSH